MNLIHTTFSELDSNWCNLLKKSWLEELKKLLVHWPNTPQYISYYCGSQIIQKLPQFICNYCDLSQGVTISGVAIPLKDASTIQANPSISINSFYRDQLESLLLQLKPWRKGPFNLYGVTIESEWRSDWKWQRLLPYIAPLRNRKVLDIGCSNGYFLWRIVGAGARLVIGVDPMGLFLAQFAAIKKLIGYQFPAYMFPCTLEQLPTQGCFDTVFSMGNLYHRRLPLEHLKQIKQQLRPGGELILETLVVPDLYGPILRPSARYAKMKNVYSIPTASTLVHWVEQTGFININIVDITKTTIAEQRRTHWANNYSLIDGLHPIDHGITIEGYPAPSRAILIAQI